MYPKEKKEATAMMRNVMRWRGDGTRRVGEGG
jgi:hypothetical protein